MNKLKKKAGRRAQNTMANKKREKNYNHPSLGDKNLRVWIKKFM